ncbi:hypothetical protein [Flavimarina sp. Hel_I_48]|uniref:hypothetical protein n=1 Tax=Flavimarina sp. Hel_I_48 TaxID=1392488 RepID=UPI0004DFA867|nr:hypothetical protein [Flavimarina sp. Hel_I_48]
MNIINLESLEGIPNSYIEKLAAFRQEFLDYEFLEELDGNIAIQELIYNINQFCCENYIIGFHFTRADPKLILMNGLLSRTGQEIRKDFLTNYGNKFNVDEIEEMKSAWKNGFDEIDVEARDNRIFFNFTKEGLRNGGADLLLKNIGGEQVYRPLCRNKKLQAKIQNLGVPLILKCTLIPSNIKTYIEHPWGKIAMSSFHRKINTNAFQTDQDGNQRIPVLPDSIEIIEV